MKDIPLKIIPFLVFLLAVCVAHAQNQAPSANQAPTLREEMAPSQSPAPSLREEKPPTVQDDTGNGNTSAKSGPAPLQEVQATGAGATEDEAFKQAVVDAVRQVVGTLVSAENVVKNDRVIKDEVLTLSDGFVEKVLNQDKTKLDDGTWQVKLKCVVRKGQLYGKLQEANVPTVKFDGVSMFADVVSQSNFRQDAHKMLAKAVRDFLRGYPSLYKY